MRFGQISACSHLAEEQTRPEAGVQSSSPQRQTSEFKPSEQAAAAEHCPLRQTRPVARVQTEAEHKQALLFSPSEQSGAVISQRHL
tara:strand:+ start:563 stop:820 length:258 start_codon:yes stop_codon:yes gene_type:complete